MSAAVTVTTPLLAVLPAAMVSVAAADRAKSSASASATAPASSVSTTASLEAPDRVAVTVATPPFSAIDAAESASARVGVASSSWTVAVTVSLTPW